jgi:hypothetical protein
MANESFENGILSSTLRTGMIKLIPKGKNNSRVEDWRPITLLPTSYKLVSGVVATRLEKTLPYIIGRSQKGFLKYKNMGTVLHNVIDGIADSWEEGDQMGVLLVDFIKAFDSVEHAFIKKALEHFNLGPVLVGMVMTLLNERKACINMGNMYSKTFDIKRGTPQGDRSSPYIFVICVEILLIKLELGAGGTVMGRTGTELQEDHANPVGEAFADDLTALFRFSIEAIKKIIGILDLFGEVSGLKINREKTHIMIAGKEWEGDAYIEGIEVKKECKLLGVIVDNKVKNLACNWEKCITKISGLINYWNQFNLTITGRILVAKTFLLSQATFLLGIIPISVQHAKRIEGMIEKYVLAKIQMARDRIYNKVDQGGLGLLKIEELDTAMKCAWVNRWRREGTKVDITGHRVLRTSGGGDVERINKDDVKKSNYPCARGIAEAWHKFREKMYENDGNMYKAVIFDNPGIRNRMGIMLGGGNIFGRVRYGRVQNQLREVTFENLCNEEGIKTKEEINGILGIQMTDVEYGKLRDCVKHTRKKFKPEWELREIGKNIREWLEPIKKGSKKYRSIMSGRGSRVYKKFRFEDVRPINTLWTQLEIPLEEKLVSCGMLLWTVREIDTDMRQFMFKWNQGMVHGNTVVSHFGDVDRKCTFCKYKKLNELRERLGREPTDREIDGLLLPDENRPHIYWECQYVRECIQHVHNSLWGGVEPVDKKAFLMGKEMATVEATMLYMLTNMCIKYRIWKYKLAGIIPKPNCIANDVKNWLENLHGIISGG